ncbi:hypothetical protein [Stenotrophomonas maltophilia]|uniref:hypothetical protein n=1 Tax=Stenotrophomonas maltophilia TaxID=40324 RepID=UPI0012FD43F6|nr:hypothetical protein [Stenotrophomonas maltophilia]
MYMTLEERRVKKEGLMNHLQTLPPQDDKAYKDWKNTAQTHIKGIEENRNQIVAQLPQQSLEELKAQKKSMEDKRKEQEPQRMKFKTMEERRMELGLHHSQQQQNKPSKYQAFLDAEKKEMGQIMEQKKRDGTYQEMGR